jgi:hypothetical protein
MTSTLCVSSVTSNGSMLKARLFGAKTVKSLLFLPRISSRLTLLTSSQRLLSGAVEQMILTMLWQDGLLPSHLLPVAREDVATSNRVTYENRDLIRTIIFVALYLGEPNSTWKRKYAILLILYYSYGLISLLNIIACL